MTTGEQGDSESGSRLGIGSNESGYDATHVVMGCIGAPYGIKGWVKLHSFADPAGNLLEYRHFLIEGGPGEGLRQIEIDEARPQGQGFVGHIRGCDVREDTRHFTGKNLLVAKSALPALPDGYYWHELEGLRVINLAGDYLGRVHHLLATGANDVLVVRGDTDSCDREERLLPWIEGQVVLEVDLPGGLLKVDWGRDY
jgi:16S rRNA processing protein RimM